MGETIDRVLATDDIDAEDVRLATREACAEDKISFSEAAKRTGVAGSTFNAWLNATYVGNNASITKSVRIWLSSRAAQARVRAAAVPRSKFVLTPSAEAFMGLFAQAQYEPDMVTLCGEPGTGKTSAVMEYKQRNSNVFLLTAEPDMKSSYAVMECLCDTFDVREASSVRRSRAIARFLAGRQALLIVDEAQLLSLTVLDHLRAFHDNQQVRLGLALVGSPEIKNRMQNGGPRGQYAQLDSRFGMHMIRRKPLAGDVNALLDAAGIEGEAERKLLRAVSTRPGGLRKMDRTLRAARMIAAGDDQRVVTAHDINRADAQLSNTEAAA